MDVTIKKNSVIIDGHEWPLKTILDQWRPRYVINGKKQICKVQPITGSYWNSFMKWNQCVVCEVINGEALPETRSSFLTEKLYETEDQAKSILAAELESLLLEKEELLEKIQELSGRESNIRKTIDDEYFEKSKSNNLYFECTREPNKTDTHRKETCINCDNGCCDRPGHHLVECDARPVFREEKKESAVGESEYEKMRKLCMEMIKRRIEEDKLNGENNRGNQ